MARKKKVIVAEEESAPVEAEQDAPAVEED